MDNIILKSGFHIDANSVLIENGYIDTTPDISLFTNKIFTKDNRSFKFLGWCNYRNRKYHAVEMMEVI